MYDNKKQAEMDVCFKKCKNTFKNLAYKYSNAYNGDSDNAYGDACLWFVEAYDKFDKKRSNEGTFFYVVVNNKFKNKLKGKKTVETVNFNVNEDTCTEKDDYLTEDIQKIKLDRYNFYYDNINLLEILKPKEKDIFRYFYFMGLSIDEIAKMKNMGIDGVKKSKRNILKKLEKQRNFQ